MNIVLIFADQMHKYAMGKISNYVHTPNLDRLCEEGVLFTDAYSNNPVCTPFRGSLFTGLYSSSNGVKTNGDALPAGIPTMADIFNSAGYETSFLGKWHLGDAGNKPIPRELRGDFKHFIGYQCYNGFHKDVHFYDEENHEYRYKEHREDVTTELAIDRLKMLHNTGKPFVHVIAYQAPHYPVQPTQEFAKIYAERTIPYDPDYIETDPYTPTFSPYSPRPFENCSDYKSYGGDMQKYMRLYYGMVSQIDYNIGKIMKTIEDLGIREETMIIFTSDHGDMQGSHGLKNKDLPYEKSCGIPLVISSPKGLRNHISDIPVSGIDLLPTCLDFADLPIYDYLQGGSLLPLIMSGRILKNHPPVIAENFHKRLSLDGDEELGFNWKMIRYGKYKMTVNWDTKEPCLLFDTAMDPYEMNNLIDSYEYADIIEKLYMKLTKGIKRKDL